MEGNLFEILDAESYPVGLGHTHDTDITLELPEDGVNIWVTYKKEIKRGIYGEKKSTEVITRRGFYNKLFNNIAIPPDWQYFEIGGVQRLLPHGWGGDRISIEEVIKWEYCKDN